MRATIFHSIILLLATTNLAAGVEVRLELEDDPAMLAVPGAEVSCLLTVASDEATTIATLDARVDFDRAQLDVARFESLAPTSATLRLDPHGSELADRDVGGWHRHLVWADLVGDAPVVLAPHTAKALGRVTLRAALSPTGSIDVTVGANARANHASNPPVLLNASSLSADIVAASAVTFASAIGQVTGAHDTDGDGVADARETAGLAMPPTGTHAWLADSDGDGISDGEELNFATDAAHLYDFVYTAGIEPNPRARDTDGDGTIDGLERRYPALFPNGVLVPDAARADDDADGLPNVLDPGSGPDVDGDGVTDLREVTLGFPANNASQYPLDGDVAGDAGVTLIDEASIARLLGDTTRLPARVWNADPTLDGAIDAADVAWAAEAWRRRWVGDAHAASNQPTLRLSWVPVAGATGGKTRYGLAVASASDAPVTLADVALTWTPLSAVTTTQVAGTYDAIGEIARLETRSGRLHAKLARFENVPFGAGWLGMVDATTSITGIAPTLRLGTEGVRGGLDWEVDRRDGLKFTAPTAFGQEPTARLGLEVGARRADGFSTRVTWQGPTEVEAMELRLNFDATRVAFDGVEGASPLAVDAFDGALVLRSGAGGSLTGTLATLRWELLSAEPARLALLPGFAGIVDADSHDITSDVEFPSPLFVDGPPATPTPTPTPSPSPVPERSTVIAVLLEATATFADANADGVVDAADILAAAR